MLSLRGNRCLSGGAKALADGIKGMRYLRWIDLSENLIDDIGAYALEPVFASMPDLQYINFRLNSFSLVWEEEAREMCMRLAQGRQGSVYLFDATGWPSR